MSLPLKTRFTAADAEAARDAWGANCGPGALAAICGLTLDEVRPLIPDFERKGYTNPTMMFDALRRLEASRGIASWQWSHVPAFPSYGLARIQWEGRWTKPGVPARVAYGYTHWVGACHRWGTNDVGIFDINCISNGTGWVKAGSWSAEIVPHLVADMKGASGGWHITHSINVTLPAEAR